MPVGWGTEENIGCHHGEKNNVYIIIMNILPLIPVFMSHRDI